jgi:hypothetical protein
MTDVRIIFVHIQVFGGSVVLCCISGFWIAPDTLGSTCASTGDIYVVEIGIKWTKAGIQKYDSH